MPDVYQQCFYHIVWTTKRREEMVLPRSEALLFAYIRAKCHEKGAFVHALGGLSDHVHLLCSIPAPLAVSDFVGIVKGTASHYMNRHPDGDPLRWQRGFSYHTFSKRDLVATVAYVRDQKKRHAENRLWPELERVPDEDGDGRGWWRPRPLGSGGGPEIVSGAGLSLMAGALGVAGGAVNGPGPGRAGLLTDKSRSAAGDWFAEGCRSAARGVLFVLSSGAERLCSFSRPALQGRGRAAPRPPSALLLTLAAALLCLLLTPLPAPLHARPSPAADLAVTLLSAAPGALQVRSADGAAFAVRVSPATWVLERGAVVSPSGLTPGEALRVRLGHGPGRAALLVCDAGTAAALDAHRRRALSGTVLAVGAVWTVQPAGEDAPVPVLLSARTAFRAGGLPAPASAFGVGASVSVTTRGLANGLLAAVSVSDSLPGPAGEAGWDAPAPRPVSLSGAVTESRPDLGLLTLTDAAGITQTVAVDAATRLRSAGRPVSLSDIAPGMRVRIRLGAGRDAAGNAVAASVSASAARPALPALKGRSTKREKPLRG